MASPDASPGPAPGAAPAELPARPLRTGLALLLPLGLVLALTVLVLALLAGAVRWMLTTEGGSRWLLGHLPPTPLEVQVQGFSGALLGDAWRAERVHVQWAGGSESVTLEGLSAQGLGWAWRPSAHAWVGLDIAQLALQKVVVRTGTPGARPLPLPASLALPLQLKLVEGRADELLIDDLAPMQAIAVRDLRLDAQPGGAHSVQHLSLHWLGQHMQGTARIGHARPFLLGAEATLAPLGSGDAPPFAAALRAQGELAHIELSGTLRGVPRSGHEAPQLDLRAALQLLQAWPLHALSMQTQALDLAALAASAPQTQLSGNAVLAPHAAGAPLAATLEFSNARPGRWSEGRLPVRKLSAQVQGRLDQPSHLVLNRFEMDLADGARAAGRWSGSAEWLHHSLSLQTQLDGVAPQHLDGRAAAMVLSGPLNLTLGGMPSPDPAATTTPTAPIAPHANFKADLRGRLDAAPQPVQLVLEGSATAQRVELTRVQATAGTAQAELRAVLQRSAAGLWALKTDGQLAGFDPLPWWPGEAGSAWRAGPHRVSGRWALDLRLPASATRLPAVEWVQRLAGNGTLTLHDALLAGVPLSADVVMGYVPAGRTAGEPGNAALRADLQLGGNRLLVDARGDPTGPGQDDRWHAQLNAEHLAALAPVARLHPALAEWVPRQGRIRADASALGRWPGLQTQGTLQAQQVEAGTLTLASAKAEWQMGHAPGAGAAGHTARLDPDAPLSLRLDVSAAQRGQQRVDRFEATLAGTLARHSLNLTGDLPLMAPPLAARLLGLPAHTGTRVQMQASAGWLADAEGGGRWRAQLDHLRVGTRDGPSPNGKGPGAVHPKQAAPAQADWLEARDLSAELQFGADGRWLGLSAEPGRLRLADALALRWDAVQLDLSQTRAAAELHANIEPFAVAPLLARAQPGAGWQGDLQLMARLDVRAGERFDADLVLERQGGDLLLSSGGVVQALGLSQARLALAAHDGVWDFTPQFKGSSLGEISGHLRVQTTPEQRWPHAQAGIEGSVQARVADAGIWSAWVPAGWRLAGELNTTVALSGQFRDPRFTGRIVGNGLAVRNLLQGVHISDGQIAINLQGDTANIETFTLRGGEGKITVTGGATLGAEPSARLQLRAERFRVLGRVDRLLVASGEGSVMFNAEKGQIEGRFGIDEGMFEIGSGDAPTLDADVSVRSTDAPEEIEANADAPRKARQIALAVNVDLGQKLRVKGRGLDSGLRGNIKLSAPGGRLAVHGDIHTEKGTYRAYGQKLEIERGIVSFNGPLDNPRLDVLALRPHLDTRVGVLISGNLLTMRVRLYSEPDASDTEKLSWLLLGRAPDGLGRHDAAMLQGAALAVMAGEGDAPTDAIFSQLGIDELSIKQADGDTRDTVIAIGKQLSRRWYLGYERGVNAAAGNWQLIYRIAQRFTVRAQAGLENSLDVIWVWRLQEPPPDAGMRKSTVVPP